MIILTIKKIYKSIQIQIINKRMFIMDTTMEDIAKQAGVSMSTVSRVFNNKDTISEETKQKVMNIAEKMNYKPRKYVKQKIHNKDNSKEKFICVVCDQNIVVSGNTFYSKIMVGAENALNENYHLIFKTISNQEKAVPNNIAKLVEKPDIKGFIFVGQRINKNIILEVNKSKKPVVLIDNNIWDKKIDCVVNDNIYGARVAVNHLINKGHQQIGFISGPLSHISMDERYIGYKQALKTNDIDKNNDIIFISDNQNFGKDDGEKGVIEIMKNKNQKPTAFFAGNDIIAKGVISKVNNLGYSVPDDIAVVGFDDSNNVSNSVSLTTVRIYKREMGFLAVKRLIELIYNINSKPIKITVSVDLMVRESTVK